MATFKLTALANVIQRIEDGAFISNDPNNVDYQIYLAWIAAGNIPQAADVIQLPDPSDINVNFSKLQKAMAIYFGTLTGKTPAQVAAGIKAAYQALP